MKDFFHVKRTAAAVLCMMIALTGCSSVKNEKVSEGNAEQTQTEEANDVKEKIVLKFATTLSPDMVSIKAIENFSEKLKEETDGQLEIQIYPSSRLGGQVEQYEAFKLGNIEMCLMASGVISKDVPELSIFGCPGLFESSEHVETFYNSDIFKNVVDKAERENDIKILGLYHEGIRNMWFGNIKVTDLNSLKGARLRTPIISSKTNSFTSSYSKLGIETVQMNWEECYTGLQSGMIDGVENNVEMVVGTNLTEFIDYEIETEHCYSALFLMINENAYDKIPDKHKEAFDTLVKECNEEAYGNFSKGQEEAKRKVAEAGIEVIKLSQKEHEIINNALNGDNEERYKELYYDEIYQDIEKMKTK